MAQEKNWLPDVFKHSHRSDGPFHAVNCAAIPENLIESELFGHEKGSFTGATEAKAGQFELCHGGTLFLDEIGDMQLQTQTKILRAIQEGEIQRVGATKVKKVDVRLLAATHKNLEAMVQEKSFREDLYYRLNVVRIKTPALRERMEDLPELVDFMLQRLNKEQSTGTAEISKEAMEILGKYNWPGNVRELENVLHSSSVISKGKRILSKDLPSTLISDLGATSSTSTELPETTNGNEITKSEENTNPPRSADLSGKQPSQPYQLWCKKFQCRF